MYPAGAPELGTTNTMRQAQRQPLLGPHVGKEKRIVCRESCAHPQRSGTLKIETHCKYNLFRKGQHPPTLKICYCLWGRLGHRCSAWSCCVRPSTLACTQAFPSSSGSKCAPLLST